MFRSLPSRCSALLAAALLAVPVFTSGDDVTVPFSVSGTTTVTVDAKADAKISPADVSKKPAGDTSNGNPFPVETAPVSQTVDVSLTGPPSVGSGDFVIVAIAQATPGAELTFTYDPDPGSARRAVFEEPGTGRRLIVFIQPPAARYRISLIGQIATDGKDPVDVATHDVTVGNPKPPGPEPDPIDPDIPPGPDLKGFAKQVYDASAGLAKATVTQAAGAYGSQVSAINAGAYNALSLDKAKEQIASAIAGDNPPRQSAVALFDLIDGELQRREESGQLATLAAVSAALAEITAGLEARAR